MNNTDGAGPSPTIAASDTLFAGSIPEIYDRYLVPLIFESYAYDLADRVARVRPQRVLEIAAGTGALTRALALRLPAHARIVATDINQSMLAYAAQQSPSGDGRVMRRQANALALPFEDGAFDVVACQFGVMFFPDKAQGYREAHRVLKPGGCLSFNVWDQIAVNEFADVVTQALATVFLEDPPLFLPRIPHGYHDVGKIKEELDATGFTSISVETRDDTSKGRSPHDVAIAYCQGTPLRNEIEARDASRLEEVTQAVGDVLARRFGSGPIEGHVRAHVVTAFVDGPQGSTFDMRS